MDSVQTVVLGALAGATILLGLPLGRIRTVSPAVRSFLNALAVGVLLFLLWDVLAHAWEPVDTALTAADPLSASGFVALLLGGLAVGLLGLSAYEQHLSRSAPRGGPGAMARTELPEGSRPGPGRGAPRC